MESSSSGDVATSCSSSLEDYLNTLTVSCEGDESEAATLTWTPDDNTPDLVYYQVKLVKPVSCIHTSYPAYLLLIISVRDSILTSTYMLCAV